VIDISGPPQTFGNQNLALVVSLADHIEGLIGQCIKNEHSRLTARFQEKQRKWGSNDLVAIDRRGAIVCASPEAIRSLATHFGAQSDAPDLSYLKSLPFEDWEGDLARRLANTRTVLVKDGDSELGAIVVFPAKHKSFAECTTSSRKRQAASVVNVPPTDAPRDKVSFASGGSSSQRGLERPVFLRSEVTDTSPHPSTAKYQFVASDARVKQICGNVASAARIGLPILISGQTGTGKEELARFAHTSSGRKGPFVPVNCTALPDSLIEAELFGYADGAFTGARRGGSRGLAKEANGGTLFLDEIGDMPFALQSVLLRFLDDYTVRPVGGTLMKVDVLIVSATNVELGHAVTSKRFRADLLYRLNTVHVTLPKLNERTDFEEIVLRLLEKISPGNKITDKAVASLARWAWEGNIRELRSVLARLALSTSDLNGTIDEALVTSLGQPSLAQAQGESLRELQRARLLEVYAETGGNISETARRLNVCRNTVYRALEAQDSDQT
jgi:sigma-54 dependent transcriptional regulator, acetoin dehydrogenase operon transcriptional activator AcoR